MNATWIMAIAALTAAATMLGGLFALSLKRRIAAVLGFSAGAVLGVALFDLLPEAVSLGQRSFGLSVMLAAAMPRDFCFMACSTGW